MSKPVVLAAAAAAVAYYLYKNKKEEEQEEVVRVSHAEALEKTTAALKAVGWDDEGARGGRTDMFLSRCSLFARPSRARARGRTSGAVADRPDRSPRAPRGPP